MPLAMGPHKLYTFSPIVGTKCLGQQFLAPDIVLNCRSQKLSGPTLLANKREKGLVPHKFLRGPPLIIQDSLVWISAFGISIGLSHKKSTSII